MKYAEIQVEGGLQELFKARSYQVYTTVNSEIYARVFIFAKLQYILL